jgi:hypothetical protein
MIVFGGGNEGIVDEMHVYNTGSYCYKLQPILMCAQQQTSGSCQPFAATRHLAAPPTASSATAHVYSSSVA